MIEFILANYNTLLALIGPIIVWFFTKRHFQNKELESKDIANLQGKLDLYQHMLDDLEIRYKTLEAGADEMELRYKNMVKDRDLHIHKLELEIIELRQRINKLESNA